MSGMKFIQALLASVLMTLVAIPSDFVSDAMAQEVPQWSATIPAPLSLQSQAPTAAFGESFHIEAFVNKTQIINLSEPVRNIIVTNEAITDVIINQSNEYQVFIVPKLIGSSNILFLNEAGGLINMIDVQVNINIDKMVAALKEILPNEDISLSVHEDRVFMSGTVQSAAKLQTAQSVLEGFTVEGDEEAGGAGFVNMIKIVGSQQVLIQVRVSEMDRTVLKELAVGLSGKYGNSRSFSFTTATPNITDAFVTTGGATRVLSGLSAVDFEALESQAMIKTLAEPTLTAISGETATFASGGEVPIQSGYDENNNALFDLVEFGILLEFTPTVLDKGRINLHISTEVSEIDTSIAVNNIPGFKTKKTETTINLPSGGSMMISGLLQDNTSNTIAGFPFLKDIPILGALFRSTQFQRNESELVITVTAYLVESVGNDTPLSLPSDGFEPSSDIDLYLLSRLHREYNEGERPFWADSLNGPFGYIMK